jgi:hypothetical protein
LHATTTRIATTARAEVETRWALLGITAALAQASRKRGACRVAERIAGQVEYLRGWYSLVVSTGFGGTDEGSGVGWFAFTPDET